MRSNSRYQVGLIGSGSWATAIAKIMTDNHFRLNWWFRGQDDIREFKKYRHHPRYLTSLRFDLRKIHFSAEIVPVIQDSEWVIIAIPSAFLKSALDPLPENIFRDKYVVSGVKGMVPEANLLLNDYLEQTAGLQQENYFSITGPCHAEEVAAEKLSYLTISGHETTMVKVIAHRFTTPYLNTIVNDDVWGAQYAAVLKNIYAVGAGMAHGLGYGDNFLSVYIANCAYEMTRFNEAVCRQQQHPYDRRNAFASAYLGDLLVTCYSQYSRNRTFGNMVGKGYSVQSAQLELGMIAEGYYAAKCIHEINKKVRAAIPIAEDLYRVLWEKRSPREAFNKLKASFL